MKKPITHITHQAVVSSGWNKECCDYDDIRLIIDKLFKKHTYRKTAQNVTFVFMIQDKAFLRKRYVLEAKTDSGYVFCFNNLGTDLGQDYYDKHFDKFIKIK